jgi:hypothetical protein
LSKGAPVNYPDCNTAPCRRLNVHFEYFSDGNHEIKCRATNGGEGGYYTYYRSGTADDSSACYYGFPGQTVWVSVDGVESNRIGW